MVVLLHFGARPDGVPRALTGPFALGWSGVDLFFVLSGFLITGILLDTVGCRNSFSSFYARRILRIFPLYWLAVLAYFHVAVPVLTMYGATPSREAEPWFWVHLSNWAFIWYKTTGLDHFWSLAIEEQFYLCWPLAVFLVPRRRFPIFCGAVIALSFVLRVMFRHLEGGWLYTLTPFRVEPLATGALIAWIVREYPDSRQARRWAKVALGCGVGGLLSVMLVTRNTAALTKPMATFGYTALAWIYGSVLLLTYLSRNGGGASSEFLRNPMLGAFGRYSYAIYVVHVPISVAQNAYLLRLCEGLPVHFQIALWFGSKVLGMAVSFWVAWVSWHVVEKRFLSLKKYFPRPVTPSVPSKSAVYSGVADAAMPAD